MLDPGSAILYDYVVDKISIDKEFYEFWLSLRAIPFFDASIIPNTIEILRNYIEKYTLSPLQSKQFQSKYLSKAK